MEDINSLSDAQIEKRIGEKVKAVRLSRISLRIVYLNRLQYRCLQ